MYCKLSDNVPEPQSHGPYNTANTCSKDASWKDVGFEQPGSYPGNSTMGSGGDVFETGHETSALVQCPRLCRYISRTAVIESQPRSGRYSFSATFRPDNTLIELPAEKDKKCGNS